MSNLLLMYRSSVALSRTRHAAFSIEAGTDFGFSRGINSLPLMAVEVPQAAGEYPIVFAGSGADLLPTAILGLRDGQNLFLSEAGAWTGRYVPAFVRRYPFVFADQDDRLTLCVDEQFAGLNQEGRGERLFDDKGQPTGFTERVLKFLQDYQAQYLRTQAFCRKIQTLGLLEPMHASITSGGERTALSGFQAVNRERLRALPPESLSELAETDELELLYLHLYSLRNFVALQERLPVPHDSVVAQPGPDAAP